MQDVQPSQTQTHDATELAAFDRVRTHVAALRQAIGRVIVGQQAVVDALLTAVLCRGHVLIVGVPGLAKTLVVRTLAAASGLAFRRIQFTPDLMPSDVLGVELVQVDEATGRREMRFVPGPIFGQLILADEINRTPPRTQAALLEAMAERQVTVSGRTMPMDQPFVVVATQNPIEQEGTYPLPEAQLDRFMLSLWMDYPALEEEKRIAGLDVCNGNPGPEAGTPKPQAVVDAGALLEAAEVVRRMPVSEHVTDYAVRLVRATRPAESDRGQGPEMVGRYVAWGAGPRASQFLLQAAKAAAAIEGKPAPAVSHVRAAAMAVLRHRIVVNYTASGEGVTATDVVAAVLDHVKEARYR